MTEAIFNIVPTSGPFRYLINLGDNPEQVIMSMYDDFLTSGFSCGDVIEYFRYLDDIISRDHAVWTLLASLLESRYWANKLSVSIQDFETDLEGPSSREELKNVAREKVKVLKFHTVLANRLAQDAESIMFNLGRDFFEDLSWIFDEGRMVMDGRWRSLRHEIRYQAHRTLSLFNSLAVRLSVMTGIHPHSRG